MASRTHLSNVRIDQALFGYVRGHTLMASSFEMPKPLERFVTPFTDLLGPRARDSFDVWLLGFPVPEHGTYFLARSWVASPNERLRPGSVWTHALFVPLDALGEIARPDFLLGAFERPSRTTPIDRFEIPLVADSLPSNALVKALPATEAILDGLYGPNGANGRAVVVVDDSNEGYDLLAVRIWTEQWPSLRRTFSFCTAAPLPLAPGGTPIALSVCRRDEVRKYLIDDRLKGAVVVQGGAPPDEIALATTNLARRLRDPQRPYEALDLLTRSGHDLPADRGLVLPLLAAADEALAGNLATAIAATVRVLPRRVDGEQLKAELVAMSKARGDGNVQAELLMALLNAGTVTSLHLTDADVTDATRYLSSANPELLAEVHSKWLQESPRGVPGQLESSLRETLTAGSLISALAKGSPFAKKIATTRPDLLADERIWSAKDGSDLVLRAMTLMPRRVVGEVFSSLVSQPVPPSLVAGVIDLIDSAGYLTLLETACQSGASVSQVWLDEFNAEQSILVEWLKHHDRASSFVVDFVIEMLDPRCYPVQSLDVSFWERFVLPAKASGHFLPRHHFLLAVAADLSWGRGRKLSERVYDAVFRATS